METKKVICYALSSGIRFFDTAQAREWYFEEGLGDALEECWPTDKIDEIAIVTKIHPRSYDRDNMEKAIFESKNYLYRNVSRPLDAVLLHAPFCWWEQCTDHDRSRSWKSAWNHLEHYHTAGQIHNIGVSNFNEVELSELLQITNKKIALIQNWMDPFHQDKIVREICKIHNIKYMAYSSLGTQHNRPQNPVLTNPLLQSIASKHGRRIKFYH